MYWEHTDVATRLPPIHTITIMPDQPIDEARLADINKCVTSVGLVSGWWDWEYLPPQATRLPWPTTRLRNVSRVHPFLGLAERVAVHTWELDTLSVTLNAEEV